MATHQAPRPWDSPGKNTGVGCHFLLQCMKVKSEREVVQSCPTLSDPMDCSLPGSFVHGIFQARVREWAATAFSKRESYWSPKSLFLGLLMVILLACGVMWPNNSMVWSKALHSPVLPERCPEATWWEHSGQAYGENPSPPICPSVIWVLTVILFIVIHISFPL